MSFARTAASVTPSRGPTHLGRKWLEMAILLAGLVGIAPAQAEPTRHPQAYALAAGDKVTLLVRDQPELSGEMLIDGGGNLVLPFIGIVDVRGLTVLECQRLIRDRLADGFLSEPVVSVRITEPRPFYILGEVRAPGVFPFRFNNTVKGAIALAGGYGPAEGVRSAARSEFLLADERVRQLSFRKRALLVRLARIEAQSNDKTSFILPAFLDFPEETDINGFAVTEKRIMDEQHKILDTQLDLLRTQMNRVEAEINAIKQQISSEKARLEIIMQEAAQSNQLLKQGLGLRNTDVRMRLDKASQEANIWRLTADVSRLQRDSGELDIKAHEIDSSYRKEILTELREVRAQLAELDVALPSAQGVREVKAQQAGALPGSDGTRAITITRVQNGEVSVVDALEITPLEPGDVVDVGKPRISQPSSIRSSMR